LAQAILLGADGQPMQPGPQQKLQVASLARNKSCRRCVLLSHGLTVTNLAQLCLIARAWKHEIEEFLRFGLVTVDLQAELDIFKIRGYDIESDPNDLQDPYTVTLIEFISQHCQNLPLLELNHFWLSASLVHKLRHVTKNPLLLNLLVVHWNWHNIEVVPQWIGGWGTLQVLNLELLTDSAPSNLGEWLHAITRHCRNLKHVSVRMDFQDLDQHPALRQAPIGFLGALLRMPSLRSLSLVADLPDMASLQIPPSVCLRCLHLGCDIKDVHEERESNARALVLRILPFLGGLLQLQLTGIAITTDIVNSAFAS
jgi:hypothetical protein